MKIIDRYILGTLVVSFLICLVGVLTLFVLIDTLERFEDFSDYARKSEVSLVQVWARFYLVRMPLMYVQFAPVVMLLASMFSTTLMVRNNELVPLLACGVSVFRVLRMHALTGLLCALSMMAVQEFVLPNLANEIESGNRIDSSNTSAIDNRQVFDGQGRVFYLGQIQQFEKRLILFHMVERHPETGRRALEIDAAEAGWEETPGGLILTLRNGEVRRFDSQMSFLPGYPRRFAGDETVTLATDLTVARMIEPNQVESEFAQPARKLWQRVQDDTAGLRFRDRLALHLRVTIPLGTLVLLGMGLPLFVGTENKNFWLGAVICIVVGAAYYITFLLAINFGNKAFLRPTFAAWAPIAIFGSLALAMLKGVRT